MSKAKKMATTTIKIRMDTKGILDGYRESMNETYDEIIKKMLFVVKTSKDEPKLSKETMEEIEQSRQRYLKGQFLTAEEVRKRLGYRV